MRKLVIITLAILAAACSSGQAPDSNPDEIAFAIDAGKRMGQQADSLEEGSMEHIKAILTIRARETEMRQAGFTVAADSFAAAAAREMGFE